MKVKINHKEVLILVPILIICVWLYSVAANFPEESRRYPQLLLIAIGAMAVIETLSKAIKMNKSVDNLEPVTKQSPAVLIRVLTVAAMCVVYVYLVDLLGFFSSTAVFSIALMYYLGLRKIKTLISVAVGLNLGVYLLFVAFLRIAMPRGILF